MLDISLTAQTLFGLKLTPVQLTAMQRYEGELIEWNSRFNLTAIRSPDEICAKHFLDSLSCMLVMRDTPMERVIDVGTGAGFPGLVLKIINPGTRLTLVESVGKKADFCRHVVNTLGLEALKSLLSGQSWWGICRRTGRSIIGRWRGLSLFCLFWPNTCCPWSK